MYLITITNDAKIRKRRRSAMYTKQSRIKTLFNAPFGKDVMELLMYMSDKDPILFKNPIVGNIKLEKLPSLTKNLITEDFLDTLIDILNREPELLECKVTEENKQWWKSAVFYQIYPRSFKDSNNDGIGDINGITSKLDYLKDIGIDAVWLSPIYDSPNDDNGYDIRDYEKIMKEFGSMDDFDIMLQEIHKRDMKLIMDLVINHTSDEHFWFQEALKGKQSKYHDYYIFKEGKDNGLPNNWTSAFKGPAWNYYPYLNEYALHVFSKKQMDLNWENEHMRKDIYQMINRWLEKGVDGFRLDVINLISKTPGLPDGVQSLSGLVGAVGYEHMIYGPKLHDYLREMRKMTFDKYNAFTVGEGAGIGLESAKYITCESRKELDQIFNFDQLNNPGKGRYDSYKYDLRKLKPLLIKWQTEFKDGCWPALVFENHDNPRFLSRITKDESMRDIVSKLVITLMLTLRGTPYFYQGQEIGMIDTSFRDISDFRDVEAINMYNMYLDEGMSEQDAIKKIAPGTRDHARIPMQWEDTAYGGFSNSKPWISCSNDYMRYNVKNQSINPESILNYMKTLIDIRKKNQTLVYGDFVIASDDADMFCFERRSKEAAFYIEINLIDSCKKRRIDINRKKYTKLLSNYKDSNELLRPYEATIYMIGDKK